MVEATISIAIAAMLLVAIGAAFVSMADAVNANEEFFRATQAARVAIVQIEAAIRRCDTCNVPSGARVDLITYDEKDISYAYDSASQQLRLITNYSNTDADYVLARNVTAASFAAESENYPGTTTSRIVRVVISIDVKVGNQQVRLSTSVVPRRSRA